MSASENQLSLTCVASREERSRKKEMAVAGSFRLDFSTHKARVQETQADNQRGD
jgi:hypothetical protein